MTKRKRLTRAEIERRLNEAWEEMIEANKLTSGLADAKRLLGNNKKLTTPEVLVARGMTIGLRMLIEKFGRTTANSAKIKNEQQLEAAIRAIKQAGDELPTAMRKAMKIVASVLPRRGGPGRQPKLNSKEAAQVCDQIALFIRRKHTLKEALHKVAELTPALVGKKVGPRTLQKAWDRRGEFAPE